MVPAPSAASSQRPSRTPAWRSCPAADQIFLRNYATPSSTRWSPSSRARTPFADRMTTTILFTDIVDSTPHGGLPRRRALERAASTSTTQRVRRQVTAYGRPRAEVHRATASSSRSTIDARPPSDAPGASMESIAGPRASTCGPGCTSGRCSAWASHDLSGLAVHFAQRLCARASGGPGPGVGGRAGRLQRYGHRVREPGEGAAQGDPGFLGGLRGPPVAGWCDGPVACQVTLTCDQKVT